MDSATPLRFAQNDDFLVVLNANWNNLSEIVYALERFFSLSHLWERVGERASRRLVGA